MFIKISRIFFYWEVIKVKVSSQDKALMLRNAVGVKEFAKISKILKFWSKSVIYIGGLIILLPTVWF